MVTEIGRQKRPHFPHRVPPWWISTVEMDADYMAYLVKALTATHTHSKPHTNTPLLSLWGSTLKATVCQIHMKPHLLSPLQLPQAAVILNDLLLLEIRSKCYLFQGIFPECS